MNPFHVIRDIASAKYNKFKEEHGAGLPSYIKEQIEYRMYLCQDCVQLEVCPHCKCYTDILFYSATKTDGLNK